MDDESFAAPGNGWRVQVRLGSAGGFTEAKRRIVLDHLAGCAAGSWQS